MNEWTKAKPIESGYYDVRITSNLGVLQQKDRIYLNDRHIQPGGYAYHTDNIEFRLCENQEHASTS